MSRCPNFDEQMSRYWWADVPKKWWADVRWASVTQPTHLPCRVEWAMSQHEFSSLYIYSNIGWWWWWWWWGRKKMDNNFLSSPLQIVYTELWSFHLSHQIKYLDIVRQILFIKESNPPSAILLQSFHSTFLDREKPLTYVYVYSNLNFLGDISNPSKKLGNNFFGVHRTLFWSN